MDEERKVVAQAIEEWNGRYSRDKSVIFELLRWETSVSAGFRADGQDVINHQINDEYDILIALFWTRFGSPTPRAASGTAEEYQRAFDRFKKNEKIEIAFYFKTALVNLEEVDLEQASAVKQFQKEVQRSGALTKSFRDDEGLKLEIGLLLDRISRSHSATGTQGAPESELAAQTVMVAPSSIARDLDVDDDVGLFDAMEKLEQHANAGTKFLEGFGQCLNSFNEVMNEVTAEYEAIKKTRSLSPSEAKPGIHRIATNMNEFSRYIESEGASYTEDVIAMAESVRAAIRLSYDFIDEGDQAHSITSFQSSVIEMEAQMQNSIVQLDEMITSTRNLQRTTTEFNKAKRRLLKNLEVYRDATASGQALLRQALSEFGVLLSEHSAR